MEVLKIKIQSIQDAKDGIGLTDSKVIPTMTKDITIGILEGGMQSGATSLMIILKVGDKEYAAEMTPGHFEMLKSAYKGAVERFGK